MLPSVINALKYGYTHFFVPQENLYELEYVPGITIYPLNNFQQIINHFLYNKEIDSITQEKNIQTLQQQNNDYEVDFQHIK
ncbi:hypothetical protein KKG31_01550 [Patescibacteria group bacterium]|nr:hypothetical protein [Patescibacteria group bacterium]MBU1757862.1 hypothetical protein [Patescibacteria group bacterium]